MEGDKEMSTNQDELYKRWEKKEIVKVATRKQSKEWRESLERELPKSLQSMDKNHCWKGQQPMSDSTGRQTIDVIGNPKSKNDSAVYIELEAARQTCVRNVIKVWMNMSKNGANPLFLVHVLSPFFKKRQRGKAESVFIGEQAEKATNGKLKYKYIQLDEWLSEDELATRIISEVRK